jgi:D-alanine-D-alanine ligase-like ATP-grasp enzyme/acylphosphatase
MFITQYKRKIKLMIKVLYYWLLCQLLNPQGRGLNPYINSPFKLFLTRVMPGNKNSAVHMLVYGRVTQVGFSSWLVQKARRRGLDGLAFSFRQNLLEAVLFGPGSALEVLVQDAWKGPKKARVEKIRVKWFKKPVTANFQKRSDNSREQVAWFEETAGLLRRTIDYLGPLLKQANRFDEAGDYSNAGELARAAESRGFFVARFSNVNYIASPFRAIGLQQSQSSRVSSIIRSLTDNKQLTKDFLARHNIPVPEGGLFTDIQEARAYLHSQEDSLVVKPIKGSYGKGVTVGVRTDEDLDMAWQYATKYSAQVILERLIHGVDIRILVIGGQSKAALLRIPANVIGDGKNNIESLIDKKNRQRMANPRLCKALLAPDIYTESFLERRGLTFRSVPEKDEVVFLHIKANIGAGADSVVITDYIHPDILCLAEETVSALGVEDFWGIDMLVERIDKPRNQQRCTVIEVNSRANIINVQFPMYGKPFDAAQALIDYLFPEKISEDVYQLKSLHITVNGFFKRPFFVWISGKAKLLKIDGGLNYSAHVAEITIRGSEKDLLEFLNSLWDWELQYSGTIERMVVGQYSGIVNTGFNITAGPSGSINLVESNKGSQHLNQQKTNINSAANYDWTGSEDLDAQLFINEFKNLGYEAKPLDEELLEISSPGFKGLTGMRFSSLFCDNLCEKLQPARVLLSLKGFPLIRGIRFKPGDIKKALHYFEHLNRSCLFNTIHNDEVMSLSVTSEKKFISLWQSAVRGGCRYIIIEEQKEGWNFYLAVVAGHVEGVLLLKPVEIVGNGHSQIAELIAEKNAARKRNPYYQDKVIIIDEKLKERLKMLGLQPDNIPSTGEIISLESFAGLELGAETVNYFELLHESFKKKAAEVVETIPGLKYATVQMIIPYPTQESVGQDWAIKKIDTRPSAAMFHFPWIGESQNLVKAVINELCLAESTQGIKGLK